MPREQRGPLGSDAVRVDKCTVESNGQNVEALASPCTFAYAASMVNNHPAFAEATICAGFQKTVATRGDVVALRTKGDAVSITFAEYGRRVRAAATGLAALGVQAGDAVAILLTNRPEFNIVDAAAMHLGGVPFSMYPTSAPEQLAYLLGDSAARVVITEPVLLPLVRAAVAGTNVAHIVLVEGEADGTITLAALEAMPAPAGFYFDDAWRAVKPESLLTIIYTSGTTGPPKGVELTHHNMVSQLRAFREARAFAHEHSKAISYLPHAHIADRMGTYYFSMFAGMTLTTCPDPKRFFEHVMDAHPTDVTGVPRVWEKLKAALEAKFAAEPEEKRAMIKAALDASLMKVRLEQAGQPVPDQLATGVARAEQMMFGPLRKALGLDEARSYFVGAAPTPREVLEFFHALGMPIAEVWGMSELSCIATAMPPGHVKLGTVGKAMPGVEVKIAEDGEIMVRGPIVMRGYRNLPEKTAETINAEGWLATGDIGEIDADGFVKIVDRKKELIINAAGKNMSPANIEARIKSSSPLIGQACVIGDARPYNVALLVLDADGAGAFARAHGLDASNLGVLAGNDAVKAAVASAIEAANGHLSRVEQIKHYQLLTDEWLPGGDELTPTMKLKRKPIAKKYAAAIEALYAIPET